MAGLDWLTTGSNPPNVYTGGAQGTSLPDWYMQYLQAIAAKGADVAGTPYQPYPGQRIADFTAPQRMAFQNVYENQGAWQPMVQGAMRSAGAVMPAVQQQVGMGNNYGAGAVAATAGPAAAWTQNWQQYMSPYTQSVVNEIGRLGTRNLMENVLPSVNDQFIAGGQFGSTRNYQMLDRAIRDTQADISGRQADALQSGYQGSANIFAADAARRQAQQQMQSGAALGAGQLFNTGAYTLGNAGNTNANVLGGLGQMYQGALGTDVQNLLGVGAMQQNLQQQGYGMSYQDFLNQRDWMQNQLGWMSNLMRGYQMPTQTTSAGSGPLPGSGYGPSPLQMIGAAWGASNTGGTSRQPTSMWGP